MIQVNRIYLIFNRLVTKKFLVDTSAIKYSIVFYNSPKDLFPVFIFKNPFIFTGCVILQIK